MAISERLATLIVGGGIGGLATALALSRSGRRVHVVEKAASFGEIGAGLQLAPNAMAVLDRLGLTEAIAAHAVYPKRLVWMDALSGERITSVDLGDAFRCRYGHPYIVMHRGDLLAVLLEACRQETLVTLESDCEIVADRGSRRCGARPQRRRPRLREPICWSAPTVSTRWCAGSSPTMRWSMTGSSPIAAPSRSSACPLMPGSTMSSCGSGRRCISCSTRSAAPSSTTRSRCSAASATRRIPTIGARPAELDAHYAQTCDYVRGCITLMWRDKRWPMVDRKPIASWTRNRVALMGDAAHPMYQYIAQGACQAIEDALVLADSVAAAPSDVPTALARL